MISTPSGAAYDESPGDRRQADDSGRFEPMKLEVIVWKGVVTVKVVNTRLASEEDSVKAICIEKAINELFVFEKKTSHEKEEGQKKLTDGKTIDV